jgi:putative glutamine amidotransferase
MEDQEYLVNSHHQQSIEKLGPNMQATAWDNNSNIEAFAHVEKPIYGIVWHPERMGDPVLPSAVRKLLS